MLKRTTTVCAVALLLAVSTACVMPDQVSQIQKDVADVRQQLRQVQQDQARTQESLDQLASQVASDEDRLTRSDLADIEVLIRQTARDISVADERMNDFGRQLDQLGVRMQQVESRSTAMVVPVPTEGPFPVEPGNDNPPGGGAGAVPDAEALYNTAYTDFSKGNYALAISGFQEYTEKFPDSPLADNALYWIGECHFSQGAFPDAVKSFDRLLEIHPQSDKAAAANLKKGLAFLEQNQISQAIIQLRYVVSTFPGSDEAKIARDKLVSLGAPV
jgi:tol-pal system protein YbgF